MATLIIDRTRSYCGECGKGTDPMKKSHDSCDGWTALAGLDQEQRKRHFDLGEPFPEVPGCGAVFTEVTSNYVGEEIKQAAMRMRPDLEWKDAGR